jgi:hypothetical protein
MGWDSMSKGRKKSSLRDLTSKIPERSEHNEIIDELRNGSDRACALIAASFLDRALMSLLATQMHGVHIDEHAPIFYGQTAILGSFSSKIRMCYVLSLISKDEFRLLNKMREIRNHFAHSLGPANFEDTLVAPECEMLWNETDPIPELLNHLSKPRAKFLVRWTNFAKILPQRYLDLIKDSKHVSPELSATIAKYIHSDSDSKESNS